MGLYICPCPLIAIELPIPDENLNLHILISLRCLVCFGWENNTMYFAVTILVCLLASRASALDTLVDLSYAQYDGTALPNGVTQWLGMRYASPPVDQLRFAPPHDPEKVEGVQAADSVGPDPDSGSSACLVYVLNKSSTAQSVSP